MKKMKLARKLLAVLAGTGIWVMGLASPMAMGRAQAAEPPVVTKLKVETDGTGIAANCDYENYTDQSGCEMRLYLYKVENSGEIVIAHKMLAYAAHGSISTDAAQAAEGVYRAGVSIDYGAYVKQINSQNYYRVILVDGNYEVKEEIAGGPVMGENNQWEAGLDFSCSHSCENVLIYPATPDKDAMEAYQCINCGAVLEYLEVPNSAYAAFQKETADLIQKAEPGEVLISTERWLSFHRSVFEALKSRPDVAVRVYYQYQGKACFLTIPAGTDIELLMDENGFGGFRYLEEVLKHLNETK